MPLAVAEDDRRRVLLGLDLALGREPRAQERRAHRLAEPRLGEQQEVVVRPRRTTTSGAMSRAFGVSSSASHGAVA